MGGHEGKACRRASNEGHEGQEGGCSTSDEGYEGEKSGRSASNEGYEGVSRSRCASGGCIVHAWQAVSFLVIGRRCSLGAAGPDHPSWEGALRRYRLLVSDSAYLVSGNKTDDKGKFVSCVCVRIFYNFDLVNNHRRVFHGLLLICEF